MTSFLLRRPVSVSMFFLAIVLLGMISYRSLSIEGQPDIELPQLIVATSWGDTSPEVVQVFLTSPIEEVGAQLEGLEEMESSSTRGSSEITFRFSRDTDMDFARLDLNERLSKLRSELPAGASQPRITMSESNAQETGSFMRFDVSGPFDQQYLTKLVNDYLKSEIGSVEGVADVFVEGEQEKSLKVSLDRAKMDLFGLVPSQVLSKVNELTSTYETARTTYQNQEFTVTIKNSIPDVLNMEEVVLKDLGHRQIKLKDVGTISLGYQDRRSMSRLNGNPTLGVSVHKEIGANVIATSKAVKRIVEKQLEKLPDRVRVEWVFDEGEDMQEELYSVYERGLWCVVLIVFLLLIFLQSVSAAVVITLNILFSVLITINFMYYFDVTVNVVTLSGLAIGFGMLVDNAIVVLENIFRHREMGKSRFDAAVSGVQEVVWAIFAATLTTVAAFLCMTRLEDRLAASYWPLAVAVIFSLSASLVVSFTFTPLLSMLIRGSSIAHKKGKVTGNAMSRFLRRLLDFMAENYRKVVLWTLRHKLLVIMITASAMFMFIRIFVTEIDRGGFTFGFNRNDSLIVFVRMPEGSEIETTDDVISQFEKPLMALDARGFKDTSLIIYPNFARMEITFDSEMLASGYPLALKSKLITIAQNFAGVSVGVFGINSDDNYYSGTTGMETYNSSIRLLGYNYKKLMDFSEDILRRVKRNRRVRDTNIQTSKFSYRTKEQTETLLQINREALRHYNVNLDYLLNFISRNLQVQSTIRTKFQGEEMYLELKYEDADIFDLKKLESLVIHTEDARSVRVSDLFLLGSRKVPGGIDRRDQQYMITVQWDYKGSSRKARAYNEAIYENLQLPAGFKAELDYSRFTSEEEDTNLRHVIYLAIIVVFMIIAALYESFVDPLVIFCTIPLSFIGVSWIYWFTGNSFDSTAYIGLIILAGIVVNNSILLVSHLNQCVREMDQTGETFHQAVARASMDRLRPILLTAITTIVGLLPLLEEFVNWFIYNPVMEQLFAVFGQSLPERVTENFSLQTTLDMFSSLSRSTVGGMLSATLSTLLIIPVVFTIFFRTKQWLHSRINEIFTVVEDASKDKDGKVTEPSVGQETPAPAP